VISGPPDSPIAGWILTMDETVRRSAKKTVRDIVLSDFLLRQNQLRVVGVLNPVVPSVTEPREIDQDEIIIGRDEQADLTLQDDSVSRRHARIRRTKSEFVLEDLDSRNGTYVDGVPIVSCILHGGDRVQIGRNLFFFARLLQYIKTEGKSES